MIEDDELLKDFVIESQEHLASVETQLLELESSTDCIDVAKVNNVFRAIHSIKGVAGFLNLKTLESLAHREEEVLNRLRNHEVRPTSQVINTLLRASDCIKGLLESITTSNEQDVSEHIHALESLLKNPNNLIVSQVQSTTDDSDSCVAITPNESNTSVPAKAVNPEVIRDFLIESYDSLEQLEYSLVTLEQTPQDSELLNAVFRTIHTLKGSSGFLGYGKLESLAHATENLLSDLRNGTCTFDQAIGTALFAAIDLIRKHLESIETESTEGDFCADDVIKRLGALSASGNSVTAVRANSPSATAIPAAPKRSTSINRPVAEPKPKQEQHAVVPNAKVAPVDGDSKSSTESTTASSAAAESTIRVDVALLDKLMTRVGELVLSRNQILQFACSLGNSDLQSASQHLNLITTELQEGVMKTRMQPIGNVWSKFPRLVRDLASICGKSVRIEMEGKETELDKTIIEAIKDPLTHLVRNNVDHGIEKPEVRVAAGKPAEGCLTLRAYHEGGQVNIEISDDGGGLNLDRIKSKAIEKGLITVEHAGRLSDREASQLIFLPGFSTAEKVSNVSGRGVGMDVVKTNIEKIGGTVDLQSREGQGTSVKIKIPLTLAIIPALIITNNGNRFAIPQVNLLELVRLELADAEKSIERIQGAPVYRLRGRLLPLVYLSQVLQSKANGPSTSDCINIVVLRVDDRQFGLVVDRINDTEEIVVKPMGKQLKGVPVFAGATIMGDGKVALILDVLGIAHLSNVLSKDRNRAHTDSTSRAKEAGLDNQTLLVLGTGNNRRLALPISQVARLEKIPLESIEYTDNQEVVQYRGTILPLIRLAKHFGIKDTETPVDGLLNVVVYRENDCNYGLVVHRVIDIVEAACEISRSSQRKGLLGSAIIHGHVTDLVDLPAVIKQLVTKTKITSKVCY